MQPGMSVEEGVVEVSIDSGFPAGEGGVGVMVLVARKSRTRMMCATVVPRKSTGQFAARRLNSFRDRDTDTERPTSGEWRTLKYARRAQ